MMFEIAGMAFGSGRLGICPLPGRWGDYAGDLSRILDWAPRLVITLTTESEMHMGGAGSLPSDLSLAGVVWRHLPVRDFSAPAPLANAIWPVVSREARAVLDAGGGVLAHCMGGCGRSGMALMRLMVDHGERADAALERLRQIRPCAVETLPQQAWASETG